MILTVKPCPEYIQPIQNLDLKKYSGNWHEMYRSIDTPSEGGECHTANYEVRNGYVRAKVFDLFGKKGLQTHRTNIGKLEFANPPHTNGNMTISYRNAHGMKQSYIIVDTDYENYSIEYQCQISLGFQRVEYLWIMSRVPIERMSPQFTELEKKVKDKMVKLF